MDLRMGVSFRRLWLQEMGVDIVVLGTVHLVLLLEMDGRVAQPPLVLMIRCNTSKSNS